MISAQKKKQKDKKRREKEEAASILKPDQFNLASAVRKQLNLGDTKKSVAEKRKDEYNNHEHNHPRVVLVCSLKCSQDGVEAKMNEFLM